MQVSNCQINITDVYSDQEFYQNLGLQKFSFLNQYKLSAQNKLLSANYQVPNSLIYYRIPGRMKLKPSTVKAPDKFETNPKYFNFNNQLTYQSCNIDVFVRNPMSLTAINITCTGECYIYYNSENLNLTVF